MTGETTTAPDADDGKTKKTRQRSTIGFPYTDLDSAIGLAKAMHGNVGLGECDDDQLAAWTKQSPKSSTFRVQIYAARTFGLLEGDGGKHKLSRLGREIVDPNRERDAKVKAFLYVPLFKAAFEQYKGGVIPPTAALERELVSLGVAEKQKGRARQVLERSAEQASFFEHGKNKLVMPAIREGSHDKPPPETHPRDGDGNGNGNGNGGGDGSDGNAGDVDPIITGLLARLPKAGSVWPEADQTLWLDLLKGSFKLIYKDKAQIKRARHDDDEPAS